MRLGSEWSVWLAAALAGLAASPAAARNCTAFLPAACLGKLSAGAEAMDDAECGTHFTRYRACLVEATSGGVQARPADPASNAEAEKSYKDAEREGSAVAFRDVAELFPGTYWGRKALREAQRLEATAKKPAASFSAAARPAPPPPVAADPRAALAGIWRSKGGTRWRFSWKGEELLWEWRDKAGKGWVEHVRRRGVVKPSGYIGFEPKQGNAFEVIGDAMWLHYDSGEKSDRQSEFARE